MRTTLFKICGGPALAGATVLGLLAGCDNDAAARVEPPPPKVSVQHPELRKLVEHDDYNGWLRATDTVDIRARVRGHLDKIHFTDGDMVEKGQLLFELDPRTFEAEIGRATDEVKVAQAQLVAAGKEETRLKELLKKGGASQAQVESAEAARQSLDAQIEAGNEEVKRKKLDLEYSRVTAPLAGRIGRSMLSVGSLVNSGAAEDVLATIVSVDPIHVYFDIDERSLQRYMAWRRGSGAQSQTQPASLRESKIPFRFQLETQTDYPNEGVLDFADNRVDAATGTIAVRGVVENDKQLFVPGSRVSIRVPVSDEQEVLVVPDTAVLTDQNKKYVLTLDDKKVVQRRDVVLGKLLDDRMRVVLPPTGGGAASITPDDWIITQGLQTARINYPVEPVAPAAPRGPPPRRRRRGPASMPPPPPPPPPDELAGQEVPP